MSHPLNSGLVGLAIGIAAVVTLGAGIAASTRHQPLPPPPADPVQRELELLNRGLFREGSKLPTERALSIELMLAQQGEAIARLSARLSALDTGRLDAIERRLASFERALGRLDTSAIGDLERELGSVRQSVESMSRQLGGLPRTDLSTIQRRLDDIQRQMRASPGGANDGELREIRSTLRGIESRLGSIERKIR